MSLDAQKLSAAKLWLISAPVDASAPDGPRDLPYLSRALYALIPVESDAVSRMSCDEWWRIYVNPAWFARATVREVAEELAHLVWHLLSDHSDRARGLGVDRATARKWDTAADIAVSHTLAPDELRPARLPTARTEGLRPGLSAEEYYAMLSGLPAESGGDDDEPDGVDAPDDGCGGGADGVPRGHEHAPEAGIGAVSGFEAKEIRRRVAIEYREQVRKRGTDPGDALRWVEEILEPRTPWEPILSAAVRRAVGWAAGRGDYSYSRRSRRAASSPGIVLPGQHRPVPRVSIIVDTSGSVDDGLLARALGEIDGVIGALGLSGSSVTAYSVDAAVHSTEKLARARDAKLVGAGGTDLRLGLDAIADERPRPDVVIVLTDGDTPWPSLPPPGAAVVVALLGRWNGPALPPTPKWAIRVECLLDD